MVESENTLAESLAESENTLVESLVEFEYYGRITMTESEWHGRVNMAESEWDSLWITLVESENALVSAHALVAAVRNLAYQSASSGPWCVRCLGTCPAWLGSRLGAHRRSHPFCKLTGSFKALIRTKNGVYSCPSLLISEKQK